MTQGAIQAGEKDAVVRTLQTYIDGGISGRSDDMKRAFHENATIHGYLGEHVFNSEADIGPALKAISGELA